MLQTIKFQMNLKGLNENLPRPKYESKSKTSKFIESENSSDIKQIKSTMKLPPPSLKQITSEKNLLLPSEKGNNLRDVLVARKPKILNKNGSQKLIF